MKAEIENPRLRRQCKILVTVTKNINSEISLTELYTSMVVTEVYRKKPVYHTELINIKL